MSFGPDCRSKCNVGIMANFCKHLHLSEKVIFYDSLKLLIVKF